jgi:hypothetical protein
MGNMSKFVAAGSLVTAGLVARKRRARLRAAAEGIGDAILPTVVAENRLTTALDDAVGEGHAPGHSHLSRPPSRWPRSRGGARRPSHDHPYPRD